MATGPHLLPKRGLQLTQLLLFPLQQIVALAHSRLHLIQVPGLLQPETKERMEVVLRANTAVPRLPVAACKFI